MFDFVPLTLNFDLKRRRQGHQRGKREDDPQSKGKKRSHQRATNGWACPERERRARAKRQTNAHPPDTTPTHRTPPNKQPLEHKCGRRGVPTHGEKRTTHFQINITLVICSHGLKLPLKMSSLTSQSVGDGIHTISVGPLLLGWCCVPSFEWCWSNREEGRKGGREEGVSVCVGCSCASGVLTCAAHLFLRTGSLCCHGRPRPRAGHLHS